jgi:folate-dependent phosphoribosylglycinamide formyltransferase PurN
MKGTRVPALRIGWFSTARGASSRAIFRTVTEAIERGLPIELAYVFCNREPGEDPATDEFLRLVEAANVPVVTLSSSRFRRQFGGKIVHKGDPLPEWRLAYDDAVLELLEPYGVSLGVLAGYMLIFGPRACSRLTLLNLHPAAPGGPIGIWQDVIWQLIAQQATTSGITIFRAEPEVDTGPPVSYCTYSLRGADIDPLWEDVRRTPLEELRRTVGEQLPLFQEIRRRGAEREPAMMVETLRALAERGIDAAESSPLDLTHVVDAQLRGESAG